MNYKSEWNNAKELLDFLNATYKQLHQQYEFFFWTSYMGDQRVNSKKDKAHVQRDAFRSSTTLSNAVRTWYNKSSGSTKERLGYWKEFFSKYQTPADLVDLRKEIAELETTIEEKIKGRKEGYYDPKTKKFIVMSRNAMRSLVRSYC